MVRTFETAQSASEGRTAGDEPLQIENWVGLKIVVPRTQQNHFNGKSTNYRVDNFEPYPFTVLLC